MRSRFPELALVLIMLLLLSTLSPRAPASPRAGVGGNVGTGLIVPLYGQYGMPNGEWDQLIRAKVAHPAIPIVAIVNAANGPGNAKNEGYASAIEKLRVAHILVLGYVWTSQGQRPILDVEQDIANYSNWYGVDGIYFDQMAQQTGMEFYYASLTQYVKSLGMVMTVGNPGASTALSYVGTTDTIVIYESDGAPSLSYLATWAKSGVGRGNFAFIAFDVPNFNATYAKDAAASVGFMFITDAKNYFVMPTYFSKQLSLMQAQLGPPQSGLGAW
jgi:Spherulation-specific family 4